MPDFTGKFQYLEDDGRVTQEGECRIHFDAETFTLTPAAGAALAFDLGDLNAVLRGDFEIRLPLYTGRTILLRQLGKPFETLAHELTEAYRNRVVECLLLEDLSEVEKFSGTFELGPRSDAAEFRLYKTNLAVLPSTSQGFHWRLTDVDAVRLDTTAYAVTLHAGPDQLKISRLGKRTEEFASRLQEGVAALVTQSAQALHKMFPFLDPDQLQATAAVLRESHAAAVSKLAAVNNRIPEALSANAVDDDLAPYYGHLVSRTAKDALYCGFKVMEPEDEPSAEGKKGDDTLYWFFFPVGNVAAWETSSRSGRATYFFRLDGSLDAAIGRLNRGLGLLNFRRRPIYLSDDELATNPEYRRYAIAVRLLPELRQLRANFLGRAIHSSLEAWQGQVVSILGK